MPNTKPTKDLKFVKFSSDAQFKWRKKLIALILYVIYYNELTTISIGT